MERIEWDEKDPLEWEVHRYRYGVAARFCGDDDVVVDAACGIGYGEKILPGTWVGVDRRPPPTGAYVDLETWHPSFPFDVWVGLETIEHLANVAAYVAAAKQAQRCIVISTPILPTRHSNKFHLQDFTRESLEALFVDDVWRVAHYEEQRGTYGIWAFERVAG